MKNLKFKIIAAWKLGLLNILRVLAYRLACKSGFYKWRMPIIKNEIPSNLFTPLKDVQPISANVDLITLTDIANDLLKGNLFLFSKHLVSVGSPPNWFQDPMSGNLINKRGHWSALKEFSCSGVDIKCIWELSRMDWTLVLARAYMATGSKKYIECLNAWMKDWIFSNPPNQGPNWKCGQEAAIRMMQTLVSAFVLKQHLKPSFALVNFIIQHCERIAPTIHYALAQDNNHGTSEAAGLFIAGSWLETVCKEDPRMVRRASNWRKLGEKILAERAGRLVENDGSFSQYSINYHRVALNALSMAEWWRRTLGFSTFPNMFYEQAKKAASWLYEMVDAENGDAPVIGPNDGALLFHLCSSPYRDHRPSVQLAAHLFLKKSAYRSRPCHEVLYWLDLKNDKFEKMPPRQSKKFDDGGYITIHSSDKNGNIGWAVLRYPRHRFRPSHSDALHLDLWWKSINLLRDGGTYSYNTTPELMRYFSGSPSHNTIEFDRRDQMIRLSRFLFGAWTQARVATAVEKKGNLGKRWQGAYTDAWGCDHHRCVMVEGSEWRVEDTFKGKYQNAVLRWRLAPIEWEFFEDGEWCVSSNIAEIRIKSASTIQHCELKSGLESRHYLEKTPLPVLELELPPGGGQVITTINLR